MTLIPQLERDLKDAWARHYEPRRLPWLAAAGAAVALVATLLAAGRGPESVTSGTDQGAAGVEQLEQSYAVFRRDPGPRDALPERDHEIASIDRSTSRLVADDDGVRVFVALAEGGPEEQLCWFLFTRSNAGGSGCTPVSRALSAQQPQLLSTTSVSGQQAFFTLVPDQVKELQFTLADGTSLQRAPVESGVLLLTDRGVRQVTALDSHGEPLGPDAPLVDDPADPTD
jgi:hypothetical protein